MESLDTRVYCKIRSQVKSQTCNQVKSQVGAQVWYLVGDRVSNNVGVEPCEGPLTIKGENK